MPIRISQELPAYKTLLDENIFVMPSDIAEHQDIRPLKVAILNLMPKKIETETQILRLLSNTPLQVDVDFIHFDSHISKNTSISHLNTFYTTFDKIKNQKYDGFIITGAPIEHLDFEEIDYWNEICEIMEWTKTHVCSTLHICWGAQAGLYYHYGIPKYSLEKKMFGVFPHKILTGNCHLLKGFDECFLVPHSRNTEVKKEDIDKVNKIEVLSLSSMSGVNIVGSKDGRQYFITGHLEYDRETLANEYFRDKEKGLNIEIPYNYFPNNDIAKTPKFLWSGHANLMYSNWLNYCVYQQTPYNINDIH